jgi:hypothetical protein
MPGQYLKLGHDRFFSNPLSNTPFSDQQRTDTRLLAPASATFNPQFVLYPLTDG